MLFVSLSRLLDDVFRNGRLVVAFKIIRTVPILPVGGKLATGTLSLKGVLKREVTDQPLIN